MERASEYPNLPTNEKIQSQTGFFGGEVLIYGLSQTEADALIRFANDNGVPGVKVSRLPLSPQQKAYLREQLQQDIPDDSIEVYLGHTLECWQNLYEKLGIQ